LLKALLEFGEFPPDTHAMSNLPVQIAMGQDAHYSISELSKIYVTQHFKLRTKEIFEENKSYAIPANKWSIKITCV
jgi:hypothetical protein